MSKQISSLHIIGSKSLGGAERFMGRLVNAMHADGQDVRAIVRKNTNVDAVLEGAIPRDYIAMRTMWDPIAKHQIKRKLSELQPDIVQTYMGRATRLTHKEKGSHTKHISRLGGYYKIKGYHHADAWVGNTKGLCDYMIQQGLPANKVFHITNFSDPAQSFHDDERTALKSSLNVPDDAILMMSFARFVPFKAINVLLDALSRIPDEIAGRPVYSIIVGDGPERERLFAQADALGIQHKIRWAGWQTNPAPYYDLADLIVFTSNDEETLGNVILEAWAYQTPLVTTRSRGGRELTTHQETAWQVNCGDSKGLAQGIKTVLNDAELGASLVTNGFNMLELTYSQAAVLNQYRALYEHVLSQP
jgi:glycosyltransferase involved in cell wall biosynthesis